jgi:DNA-binding NtrC family response regulator
VSHDHRVLIVEDDYAFRWTLAVRFQRRGVDTDVAENVREARDLISTTGDYCCVLLDLKLPRLDGESLLETLAERDRKPPVVVVTGYPDVWQRLAGSPMASKIRTALMKPVEADVVVNEALRHCAH